MALCTEDLGRENEDLIDAMAAFCNGMGHGKICGTLASAVAALYVANASAAQNYMQDELMDWFNDQYGGYDCFDIIRDDPVMCLNLCPVIVEETYTKLSELLWPESNDVAFPKYAGQ
jgi:hypothetical protein